MKYFILLATLGLFFLVAKYHSYLQDATPISFTNNKVLLKSQALSEQPDQLQKQKPSCMDYFTALDNLLVKFFTKQDFTKEAELLSNNVVNDQVQEQLSLMLSSFNHNQASVVINPKIIDKVIHIEKKPAAGQEKERFLESFKILEQYFYSTDFIRSCYEN